MDRLRDMEHDRLIDRRDFGGSPPHVEYALTDRGRLLAPLLESLRALGHALGCNDCDDRHARHDTYCDACPRTSNNTNTHDTTRRAQRDDSIVLL